MNYLQKKKLAFMSIVNRVKGFIRTITGVLPLTLEGCVDEESIIDYTLYGQSVQDGTPAPEAPVEVESVGEKTTNLINWDLLLSDTTITKVENGYYSTSYFHNFDSTHAITKQIKEVLKPNITYTLSRKCSVGTAQGATTGNIIIYASNNATIVQTGYWGNLKSKTFTLTQEQIDSIKGVYIYFSQGSVKECTITNLQLTESGTVLPYEPYGYKIPITASSNGKTVTTNIYLDEPLRKVGDYADYIKSVDLKTGKGTAVRYVGVNKLLANSNISFTKTVTGSSAMNRYYYAPSHGIKYAETSKGVGYCTVLRKDYEFWNAWTKPQIYFGTANYNISIVIPIDIEHSYSAIYNYLSNNGKNEVVIYYQLATPTETPITLPPIPTFKGTSIISADTTIQPSNAEITYYSNVKE